MAASEARFFASLLIVEKPFTLCEYKLLAGRFLPLQEGAGVLLRPALQSPGMVPRRRQRIWERVSISNVRFYAVCGEITEVSR